jgi:hypothetical protein
MPDDLPELPEGVGPHNDKELELMLAGEKPLAMFSDLPGPDTVLPTAAFAPHVAAGEIIMTVFNELLPDGRTLRHEFYALPGEEWRIEPAYELLRKRYDTWCEEAANDCREIGKLLGYSEADIEVFIEHVSGS